MATTEPITTPTAPEKAAPKSKKGGRAKKTKAAVVPADKKIAKKGAVKGSARLRKGTAASKSVDMGRGSIRRLARRGGAKRLSGAVYPALEKALHDWLTENITDTLVFTEQAKRKTVTKGDFVHALQRQGKTICGYH